MKKETHPDYQVIEAKCTTCGTIHSVGTTSKAFTVDVCSKCHPFYTGNSQSVKSTGRVERFNRMFGKDAKASK